MTKSCPQCRRDLPIAEFSKNRSRKDGHAHHCKGCCSAQNSAWRSINADRHRATARRWAANNPDRFERNVTKYRSDPVHKELAKEKSKVWYAANKPRVRQRDRVDFWASKLARAAVGSARSRGHAHAIDEAFVMSLFEKQNGRCFWTGVPLVPSVERGDPQRPSIDRFDNNVGYEPANCVLACWFANRGRGSVDSNRFATFIREMKAAIIDEAKQS